MRLNGPAGNRPGVGAQLRLKFHDHFGPLRELHAGSGYWSQDGAIQVLATPDAPTQIEVRWPGGKTTTADLPAGAKEIAVELDGKIKVIH